MVGGGCYGTFYASQLAKAKARGKVDFRSVIVVDRYRDCRARRELDEAPDRRYATSEWGAFFDAFLPGAADDHIVPSPHMPHLMFEWVLARARQRWPGRAVTVEPVPGAIGTPYDRTAPDGTRYVSFADWICPTHCIEPALCPAIGAPRAWEMGDAVRGLAERLGREGRPVAGPALGFSPSAVGYYIAVTYFGSMIGSAAAGGWVARFGPIRRGLRSRFCRALRLCGIPL